MDNSCFEVFDQVEDPNACKCRGIVLNAYANMKDHGMSDREAIKAATKILQYHHPSPGPEARNVVECWIFQNSAQPAH